MAVTIATTNSMGYYYCSLCGTNHPQYQACPGWTNYPNPPSHTHTISTLTNSTWPIPVAVKNQFKCETQEDAFEKAKIFQKMIPEDQQLVVVGRWLLIIDNFDPAVGAYIQVPPA